MVEAAIIHKLPVKLNTAIGRVIVTYAALEHKLSMVIAVILQLQKAEARLVMKEPRIPDRLDTIQDLLALRDITVATNFIKMRELLDTANRERDQLAHGVWLRHPKTRKLYLRLTKGTWKRTGANQNKIKRHVFPQSIPYSATECLSTLATIARAIELTQMLGAEVDAELQTSPDKFRPLAPVLNPLGHRSPIKERGPHFPSRA